MIKYILAIVMSVVSLTGCAAVGQPTDFNGSVLQNQAAIRATTGLATSLAMLQVEPKDRVDAARLTYEISKSISDASESGFTDLSSIDALAQDQLAKWNSPYRVVVGTLIKSVVGITQNYIDNYYKNNAPEERTKALNALIFAAASGISDGSLPYTQGIPKVQINAVTVQAALSAQSLNKPKIEVKSYKWN